MKKILKIISVFAFTSITSINISACDVFQNSSVDYQQLLEDAANLIANNTYPNFNNFLKPENKTHVFDFKKLIEDNISNLFNTAPEDFSNITYEITNGQDEIKKISTTNIKIHLAVYNNSTVKDCSFNANFSPLQDYINEKLEPLVNGTQYLSINKKDSGGFYNDLVTAGATFKREEKNQKEQYLRNNSDKAKNFWKLFQEWIPSEEVKNPLLGNILVLLLNFIPKKPFTWLTFDNFKPYLLNAGGYNNVIAITGNKKFGDKYYDYIKIGLKGKNSKDIAFGNKYEGLTFIFTTNS
ncbi:hypothetical protein [Spiroplasma endosymbiont of Danaus chrysippus]|uniref:hypothetical protein n=1 Tax=Spiroplasma endosymbiont of Danaus chrysippus TaxID=2691041 RepID=UPI00157B1B0A|nr:hypothetical protein [Spiroplasma endosymbiont of Danaus chrysippus]